MTDPRERDISAEAARKQEVRAYLAEADRDVAALRGLTVLLETGDLDAWKRVQNSAHNLAARANTLRLGVLNAAARELTDLTEERLAGRGLDPFLLQCALAAIDTLGIEIETLRREF